MDVLSTKKSYLRATALVVLGLCGCTLGNLDNGPVPSGAGHAAGASARGGAAGAGGWPLGGTSNGGSGGGSSGGYAGTGGSGSVGGASGWGGAGGAAGAGGTGSAGTGGIEQPLCTGACFPDDAHGCDSQSACNVQSSGRSECVPPGNGVMGAACASALDCSAGLGCAAEGAGGACRPYCCVGYCTAPGELCLVRPLVEGGGRVSARAPFCAGPSACDLSEPTSCGEGLSCLLHADGTTWCEEPGLGTDGAQCPCAAGYFCAVSNERCRKLCRVGVAEDCPTGACQSVATFPSGYGVCSGTGG